MSEGSEAAGSKRHAAAYGVDRLGGLPDDLLLDILSFLPSPDAVRTCVLARRWRNLWKGVPALRISPDTAEGFHSPSALNGFVNHMLLLRDRVPLRTAELNSFHGNDFDASVQYLELWVRYSLSCRVAELCVANDDDVERWLLPKGLIISRHLRSLELARIMTEHDLDFSSCRSLVDLKIEFSGIYCERITSPSLKHLSISECRFLGDVRTQISVPNLISLLLDDCTGRTPLLESMPLLVDAIVVLPNCSDYCRNGYEVGDCGDESCWGCSNCNYGENICVVLQGLSSCTNLQLAATSKHFIFRKDLMGCPVFSNLETLLLNEWCITANLDALICFLQHSPVLEKLTLEFPEIHENLVEMGVSYDLKRQPLVLKDLTVEVNFHEGDEEIHKVLDVLSSYGLPPEKIIIKQYPKIGI
ncbi:unnamed protein product [Urochloa decumbens]|uniref:F-box domain-containing protein n=1 Tax=Urochloa decumbens TaxID=240449 RepID=A0ABC9ALD4_9POAL